MRIRAIEVRNWACIESLVLPDLPDGVVVLHGPNRAGKSSLVQAMRSCIFDHFHNSQDGTILGAVPRRTKAAPSVSIELELGNARYRIGKTFAKTKDGQAVLEQHGPTGWTVLVRGKDAAEQLRKMLGVDKSDAGIYQMLWLRQQDFRLPRPDKIDNTLAKALESVLGTMITGRDVDFKMRLDDVCKRWFTDQMRDKKDSPLTQLAAALQQATIAKAEIDLKWSEAESALTQYEEAQARRPQLQRELQEADDQLTRIREQREAINARLLQASLATTNRDKATQLLAQAQGRLEEWTDVESRARQAEEQLGNAQEALQHTEETLKEAEAEVLLATKAFEECEHAQAQHQMERAVVDDRQMLLNISARREALDQCLQNVEGWLSLQRNLETDLSGPVPLSEKQINDLRRNRDEAIRLRARLDAEQIHVMIRAWQSLDCSALLDGRADAPSAITGERQWTVRQQAEFNLGGLATIRIGRGREDHDLEETARQLMALDVAYDGVLCAAGVDKDQSGPIDVLNVRRLQHQTWSKELVDIRDRIVKTAPKGMGALQAELRQFAEDRAAIVNRRPELDRWLPNQPEIDAFKKAFDERDTKLRDAAKEAKQRVADKEAVVQSKLIEFHSLKTDIAGFIVAARTLRQQLGFHASETLNAAVEEAKGRLAEAEIKVQECALSEAEQAIETEYVTADGARSLRDQRARDNDLLLERLRTQLAGTEGLHQKRIQAEQALADAARDHEREQLNAQAHRRLKVLFEEIRQAQVRRTVGPINDRVMKWARQLGLADYAGLSFGEQLLPDGLLPAQAVDGEAVGLDTESFGTLEQLSLLVRLAVGGLLARDEPAVAILDDPLAHADLGKHGKMLEIFKRAARGESHAPDSAGPLQLIILTCHPERFDYLTDARHFDLSTLIRRGG